MSACPDKLLLLHGLVDGELDAANALELEAHLKTCPGCAAELERLQVLRNRLADPGLRDVAPAALRARIEQSLAAEARAARSAPPRWRAFAPFALSGAVAALAATLVLTALPLNPGPNLDRELVSDHVRSLLATHLVDVVSEDRHTVKPWFAGRIDYSPPVVDLKDQGFPLAGGRLDYVEGKVTAALVYKRRLHVINLFIRPAKGGPGPGAAAVDGYNIVHWRRAGLECWAVSDLNKTELEEFRDLFEARAAG